MEKENTPRKAIFLKNRRVEDTLAYFGGASNLILCGSFSEPLCSRVYRNSFDSPTWKVLRKTLDAVFFWERSHCAGAYVRWRRKNGKDII